MGQASPATSVCGVCFLTQQGFSPGEPLECTLAFEYVDPDEGTMGVAVAITAYRVAPPA